MLRRCSGQLASDWYTEGLSCDASLQPIFSPHFIYMNEVKVEGVLGVDIVMLVQRSWLPQVPL